MKILFTESHNEQLLIFQNKQDLAKGNDYNCAMFSSLLSLLEKEYLVENTTSALTTDDLAEVAVLVIGAPQAKSHFTPGEIEVVNQFVKRGGGVLVLANQKTMWSPPHELNQIAALAGGRFEEYHNYPPSYLQLFKPHSLTANIKKVEVDDSGIAALRLSDSAKCLATTKSTRMKVMSAANVGSGRMVLMGAVSWLSDDYLKKESNEQLAQNIFQWLAGQNEVEVRDVVVPSVVQFGHTARVVLQLDESKSTSCQCVLKSDAGATVTLIRNSPSSIREWMVCPAILGDQKLRLTVSSKHETLKFEKWSTLNCVAPGEMRLEIDKSDSILTTGEIYQITGFFSWNRNGPVMPQSLQLDLGAGLIERNHEEVNGRHHWQVLAVCKGTHQITLTSAETGQSVASCVEVRASDKERLAEIQAAYVCPLEAEITERLRQVDSRLVSAQVCAQPFKVLPPEDFVEEIYNDQAQKWLQGVLAAARREQWHNFELLNNMMTYFSATYMPNRGSFIPYDPDLASHLLNLHPGHRRAIKTHLGFGENERVQTKQILAAYLLHEKFGHGFFYAQTRLGQQVAILYRHGFTGNPETRYAVYSEVVELIFDSVIIVNEGLAAWMEETFLPILSDDVGAGLDLRLTDLIENSHNLYSKERTSEFFTTFPPLFDSQYREGFEYLCYFSKEYGVRCALDLFLAATDIELGISEQEGGLHFEFTASEMKQRLLDVNNREWVSHLRLRNIAEDLYANPRKAHQLTKSRYCKVDCLTDCPLTTAFDI